MMHPTELDLSNDRIGDAALVAAYLQSCPVLIAAAGLDPDPLSPGAPPAVPIGVASDGTYSWPLSVGYFASVHGIAPAAELLSHIRDLQHTPPALSPEDLQRLRTELAAASGPTGRLTSDVDEHPEDPSGMPGPWGDGPPT